MFTTWHTITKRVTRVVRNTFYLSIEKSEIDRSKNSTHDVTFNYKTCGLYRSQNSLDMVERG